MNKADKLLYQENKTGSNFVMGFVMLNMAFTVYNLRVMPIDLNVGMFVMYNIFISLVGFLASTKMKIYHKKWAYAGLVIALAQLFRILSIPDVYESGFYMILVTMVVLSAVFMVAGSLITIRRSTIKEKYESGLNAQ